MEIRQGNKEIFDKADRQEEREFYFYFIIIVFFRKQQQQNGREKSERFAGVDDSGIGNQQQYHSEGHSGRVQELFLCRQTDHIQPADVDYGSIGDAPSLAGTGT